MDKKELKEAYKRYKPEMGVYVFRCRPNGMAYLGFGQNLKGDMNSVAFQLKLGNFYSNTKCNLQNDWNKYGESAFDIEILEFLEYDKGEVKTDYKDDLRVLREFCSEKLSKFEYIQK